MSITILICQTLGSDGHVQQKLKLPSLNAKIHASLGQLF